jgi:type II secretory pathway pseudopilin PulG
MKVKREILWKSEENQAGFTIVEMLVTTSLSLMTLGIVYTALVGMQWSARATVEQVNLQKVNKLTLQKVGRVVMSASRVDVETDEGEQGILHVWNDTQEVWTPDTTEDDVEGMVYYDVASEEVRYKEDVDQPDSEDEVLASGIEELTFEMVGNAVFMELTMEYDVDHKMLAESEDTKRTIYASFAARNAPRTRIGATQ